MLNLNQVRINSVVNFEYYGAAIMGAPVRGAKVLAILDADSAAMFINPMLMHANIKPFLPTNAPSKYTDYSYLKLKLADGTVTAVGLPWVRGETWEEVSVSSMRFTVPNVPPEKQQVILRALAANGFTAVDVETLS